MSRKSEYFTEEKRKACIDFLSGAKSAADIASDLNMGKELLNLWSGSF